MCKKKKKNKCNNNPQMLLFILKVSEKVQQWNMTFVNNLL